MGTYQFLKFFNKYCGTAGIPCRALFYVLLKSTFFSPVTGLFVHPDPGLVLLNYGLEDLRFTALVAPGDTIQAKLIVKRKTIRQQRKEDNAPFGMVWWDVEVTNQKNEVVAEYTILTLVKRKNKLDIDL